MTKRKRIQSVDNRIYNTLRQLHSNTKIVNQKYKQIQFRCKLKTIQ